MTQTQYEQDLNDVQTIVDFEILFDLEFELAVEEFETVSYELYLEDLAEYYGVSK